MLMQQKDKNGIDTGKMASEYIMIESEQRDCMKTRESYDDCCGIVMRITLIA